MNKSLARVLAHVCGDGWICIVTQKRSQYDIKKYNRKKKTYTEWQIGYSNNNQQLLKQFQNDIKKLTNFLVYKGENRIQVRDKKLYFKLSKLGAGNSRLWTIPPQIFNSNDEIKSEWLKAFFDDESTVEIKGHRRIRVKSVNLKGLFQMMDLLRDFDVISTVTGPNSDDTWYLNISDYESLENYRKSVGFSHQEKSKKLRSLAWRKSRRPQPAAVV